jgi:hypothetical protein
MNRQRDIFHRPQQIPDVLWEIAIEWLYIYNAYRFIRETRNVVTGFYRLTTTTLILFGFLVMDLRYMVILPMLRDILEYFEQKLQRNANNTFCV